MAEWVALKPPPLAGDVIRFTESVRGSRGREVIGRHTLEAKVISITGTGTRDDNLTLKVLAESGIETGLTGRWILRRGYDVYRLDSQMRVSA